MLLLQRIREAVEEAARTGNYRPLSDQFAPDGRVYSLMRAHPHEGRLSILKFFGLVGTMTEEMRIVGLLSDIGGDGNRPGGTHGLLFESTINGQPLDGICVIELDDQGQVTTMRVMSGVPQALRAFGTSSVTAA
ncbi:hypothetical protein GCM10012275_49470 [Longimycelium tulufanense]|uniref:SnoaL-like domain-containing protein n=1 Tax=Longimycelium tulufanense TaxID=907463 RepID=A0A8J3FWM3_9PSEU|nr:hypothetical protein [Longimycelium tulufanense]GGM72958.1 hypothetical protein GCM10012275_49470 [Longimycelium tulufanense]